MLWNVVRKEDANETEGKGIQNCGKTSYAVCVWPKVWGRYLSENEGT